MRASFPQLNDDAERLLVVGRVTHNPRKDYPRFKLLASYLAARLEGQGITGFRVQFAKDHPSMVALLRANVVDLIPESMCPALLYVKEAEARLLLREWRDGVPAYHTLFFCRRDSSITALSDLLGQTIAFEDSGSTSSYFLPRAELEAAGLPLIELPRLTDSPPADAVGYIFAGSENNVVAWVYRGRVGAGAFSNVDWRQEQDVPLSVKRELKIFHRTAPVPRSLVVVRGNLPRQLRRQLKRVLLTAHKDHEGRSVLNDYKAVTRYDELKDEFGSSRLARKILDLCH